MDKLKSIYASAYSACITIVVVCALTISGDLNAAFKTWLASFTGHHWVTKSWVSMILFAVIFLVIRLIAKNPNEAQTKTSIVTLEIVSILGFVSLVVFYFYEFFK